MAKDSRLTEIFRQELKKDKGLMSAFLAAAGERGKERSDIRNILPKSGISGAIAERMFGKSYRASSKNTDSKVERTSGDITSSKYLPGMAKDMNLMRLNMQKLVTLAGGKPSKTVSTGLLKGKDTKIAEKKESGGMLGTAGNMLNGAASMAGGALNGIGKLGGGILSMGGSMLGGIASGIGNIGGSILGGLTGILGSLGGGFLKILGGLVSFGLPGMLIALGAGSLISAIFTSFDFKSLGGIFTDTFDGITKVLQDFFGVNKEGNKDKSFIRLIAETLDEKFETTKFTESLDYIGKKLRSITDTLEVQIRSVYVTIQNHAKAAFETFADIMLAVGSDIKGITTKWFDDNMIKIYTLVGTLIGGVIGSIIPKVGTAIGATIGGTLGAATAFTIQKEQSGGENDRIALENIQKRLDDKSAPGTREFDEKRVIELKKRIADRDATYESNKLESMRKQGLGNTFNTHLASEYEKNPLPTSPTKIPGSNVSGTGGSYNDRIARGESGGKYDTIFGKAGGAMINGKLVTENTIAEVVAWQKSMAGTNEQAAGKYQFMNVDAAAKSAGLSSGDLFNGINQEKMQAAYTAANKKSLRAAGLPDTDEYASMAHAVGVGGIQALLKAQQAGEGGTLSAADAFLKYGTFKGAQSTWAVGSNARKTNNQLNAYVDDTIAKLSNKVNGTQNLASNKVVPVTPNPDVPKLSIAQQMGEALGTEMNSLLQFVGKSIDSMNKNMTATASSSSGGQGNISAYNDKAFELFFNATVQSTVNPS